MTKRPFAKRRLNGTASIQRDSYSNDQTDWWTIRKRVFERDGGRCQSRASGSVCGRPGQEVHHVTPLGRGGTTTMANLITLCRDCHDVRHAGHTIRRTENKPKNPWGRKPTRPAYKP